MITDGEKWHCLALKSGPIFYGGRWCNRPIKRLSKLFRGKPSNHHGDFYCLNCFNSYSTKNRPKEHEEICNKQDSSSTQMFRWVDRILKYTYGEKPLKAPFAIYPDLECLLEKEQSCQSNPEKWYTEKKKSSGLSLLAGQFLQNVHLIQQKINSIFTEEGIVLKNYVKS